MTQRYEHDGHVLEIEQAMIDVTSSSPRPDPNWQFTDAAGHPHAYGSKDHRFPTLVLRSGEPYWDDDLEDEVSDSWYECPLCGEKVKPGTYVPWGRQYEPGRLQAILDGEPVTEQEVQNFIARAKAASVPRRSGKTAATEKLVDDAVRAGEHVHIVGAGGQRCVSGECDL